jgi:hypothetical protein
MNNILHLFCNLDDFCKWFIPLWEKSLLEKNKSYKKREFTMSPAEVMSLLILFHQSNHRHFKGFYTQYAPRILAREFPKRVSYQRVVELAQTLMIPLSAYLHSPRVNSSGIAFIDSTPLWVCTTCIELITSVRKNMKKEALSDFDRVILRKRTLIETVFGQLKSISQIEHSRHRSLLGFMVNVLAGLIAYSWKIDKPSLNLRLNPDFSEWAASSLSSQPIIS